MVTVVDGDGGWATVVNIAAMVVDGDGGGWRGWITCAVPYGAATVGTPFWPRYARR
jgi:hypothetical protein